MERLESLHLFTDVLIKAYLGYFFPNLPSADFVPFIKVFLLTSFLMRSGNEVLCMIFVYISSKVECLILSPYILFSY